jgi:hypothetical protein
LQEAVDIRRTLLSEEAFPLAFCHFGFFEAVVFADFFTGFFARAIEPALAAGFRA